MYQCTCVLMFDSLLIGEECRTNSERTVFAHRQNDPAQLLQGSITGVAAAAFSRGLISSGARDIVVDGTANHDKVQIIKVLNQIHQAIVADPGKLRIFINEVLRRAIGAPVQHLIVRLGEH